MTHNTDIRRCFPATAAFAPLDAHRAIRVSGADSAAFLQGQLSNDIDALDGSPAQLSSFNSPKGRVIAFLRVAKLADGYRLVVDAGIRDAIVQRLRMFVLRSKVSIELDDDFGAIGVAGWQLDASLAVLDLPAPQPGLAIEHDGSIMFGMPGPAPRIEIHAPVNALPTLDLPVASAEDLARWDLLAGLPRITPAIQDAHVAQHLALDTLGAISFRKGCYTGQEIIARMKYLGRVKKRASIFHGTGAAAGDSVRTQDDRPAGDVVNVVRRDNAQLVLAVVNLDDQDAPLTVNGRPLSLLQSV